jgi:hypothetical protein
MTSRQGEEAQASEKKESDLMYLTGDGIERAMVKCIGEPDKK